MICLFAVLFLLAFNAQGQAGAASTPADAAAAAAEESAIREVMAKSVVDWNKGDLDAFATSYKNSPDTLFIGARVSRGYYGMLESYKKGYATPAARGVLSFSNLEVHPLDSRFAAVIGNCHLERTAAGGGNYDCIYSLIFEKTPAGWKIVLDHSSALPGAAKPAAAAAAKPATAH
jgi:ketosteroid isomerase-like protein